MSKDASGEAERPGGPQLTPATARRLEERVGEERAAQRLPSLIVGLARDGELDWWAGRGSASSSGDEPPTPDTQYRIGSISKTFTAVAAMRLRDEGALDLSDPIGAHLPELSDLPVTVAQLLSHTSGLRAESEGAWWERTEGVSFTELAASSLGPGDLLCRPGRRFHYSNLGFGVLGELVARLRGSTWPDVVQHELLDPLGMRRTTLRPAPPHAEGLAVHPHAPVVLREPEHDALAMAPAGQLWSTLEDLVTWSSVLSGRRPEVLGRKTAAEMAEPLGITDSPGQPWTMAYGLGFMLWNQAGRRRLGHAGAMPGHMALLLVDAATNVALVAATNSTYQGFRGPFFDELLGLFEAETPAAPAPAPFPPARGEEERAAVAELVGWWYWGPVPYRLDLLADGRLELCGAAPSGRDGTFRPAGDGTYRGESGYFTAETLVVHRAPDGTASHLDIASFVFTRAPYAPGSVIPGGVDEAGWR